MRVIPAIRSLLGATFHNVQVVWCGGSRYMGNIRGAMIYVSLKGNTWEISDIKYNSIEYLEKFGGCYPHCPHCVKKAKELYFEVHMPEKNWKIN